MFNNYVVTIFLPPLNIINCSIKTHIFFILNVYSCIHSTWLDLVILGLNLNKKTKDPKHEHKDKNHEHEVCKIKVQRKFYYDKINININTKKTKQGYGVRTLE